MHINKRKSRPCFHCGGTGQATKLKPGTRVCFYCEGYGSIGLKVLMQGLNRTNSGETSCK